MYSCWRCKTELPAGTRFCPQCGFQFDQPVPDGPVVTNNPSSSPHNPPTVLVARPKSNSQGVIKAMWWAFLSILCLAAFGAGPEGNIGPFVVLGLLGLPSVWLMMHCKMKNKVLITSVWFVSTAGFGIYSLTPVGKAAYATEQRNLQTQHQQEAKDQATEDARQAAQEKADTLRADAEKQQQAKAVDVVQLGDVGVIRMGLGSTGGNVYIAVTQNAFSKMLDAVAAKDDVGLEQLVDYRKVKRRGNCLSSLSLILMHD